MESMTQRFNSMAFAEEAPPIAPRMQIAPRMPAPQPLPRQPRPKEKYNSMAIKNNDPREAYNSMIDAIIRAILNETEDSFKNTHPRQYQQICTFLEYQFDMVKPYVIQVLLSSFSLFQTMAICELFRRGEEQMVLIKGVLSMHCFPEIKDKRLTKSGRSEDLFVYRKGGFSEADAAWKRIRSMQEFYLLCEVECPVCFDTFLYDDSIGCRGEDEDRHRFCNACISGQAEASLIEGGVAIGGIGLKCLVPECYGHIPWAHVKAKISRNLAERLNKRIDYEALVSLDHVEKCKSCDFAMIVETSKEDDPSFRCKNPKCGIEFCRSCNRDWAKHAGKKCEELMTAEENARKTLEEELTLALVRVCPNCKLEFQKESGCNKMTCRCGTTQCYICRQSNITYDHFGGNCILFDTNAPIAAEAQRREQVLRGAGREVDDATLQALLRMN